MGKQPRPNPPQADAAQPGLPRTGSAQPRPIIAVSMGDPGGIGAEVIVKALGSETARDLRRSASFRIFGLASSLHAAAERAGIDPFWWQVDHDSPLIETTTPHDVVVLDYQKLLKKPAAFPAAPSRLGGELSLLFVEDAIAAAKATEPGVHADAIVTAPISKASWDLAGKRVFPGHTELLGYRLGASRVAMLFESPQVRVVLATVHLPLMEVKNVLTIGAVFDAIDLGNDYCRSLGIARPRIAVCGLNPHAGEGGLFGDEEARIIEPAIRAATDAKINAKGPFPADTIFNAACAPPVGRGKFDLVVAMYHDQGLIPVKLLAWDRAVNVTLGLPTIRTSPDHGTAFDIAGQNAADPGSMSAALALAVTLAAGRRAASHPR